MAFLATRWVNVWVACHNDLSGLNLALKTVPVCIRTGVLAINSRGEAGLWRILGKRGFIFFV